jgi:hypothetical protein
MSALRWSSVVVVLGSLLVSAPARADTSTIKRPGAHPRYTFEAEPHLVLDFFDPPAGDNTGFGPGFRGTFNIADRAFISSINNSVGIGFGADWILYGEHCKKKTGPADCENESQIIFPVVLQWNFWISRNWSVFAEPGVAYELRTKHEDKFRPFVAYGGARFHFSDTVALTLRAGWPSFSVGVSFLL